MGSPGLELALTYLDTAAIIRDELALVQQLRDEKYAAVLRELEHVTLMEGRARFTEAHTIDVGGQTLPAERFVIATGSTATVPPIAGLQDVGFLTHIEALRQERLPESLVVIGAGPVGLEFSQLYARFGARVTVLQRGPSIGVQTEPALAQRLVEVLERGGIRFVMNARVIPGGYIESDDGARIAFDGKGYGLRSPERYRVRMTMAFRTEDARYGWLNRVLGLMTGISTRRQVERTGASTCQVNRSPQHTALRMYSMMAIDVTWNRFPRRNR